jgi:acetyltransferase-like isoleucine patch superfamily enzyme
MNFQRVLINIIKKPSILLNTVYCKYKSWILTRKIDQGRGKIIVTNLKSPIIINKGKNAKLIIDGDLRINSHLMGASPIRLLLSENSILHIKGDFAIGNGVCISIHQDGRLLIGGRLNESDSGITADTTLMVFSSIEIGYDFICAWGVFITDSNWHYIEGQNHQGNVKIGNHVWITNNCNILKNSVIGHNCVVASNTKIINQKFESDTLIAGVPAKVVKAAVRWKRDV